MKSKFSNSLFLTAFVALFPLAYAEELPKTALELRIMQGSPPSAKNRITLDKWDTGPHNRWAFQHISEIIPTAIISRGSGTSFVLPRATHDISGFVFDAANGKKITVKEMLDTTYTDGFIVLHHGKVVFEKYLNGLKPDTRHLLMSVSKSVTGTTLRSVLII